MTICVQVSVSTYSFISLGTYQEEVWLDHMGAVCAAFKEADKLFFTELDHFTFPPAKPKRVHAASHP